MNKINFHCVIQFKDRLWVKLAAFSLLSAILIASFFTTFNNNLQQNIKEQSEIYLTENGSHAVNKLNNKVTDIFSALVTLSSFAAEQSNINNNEVLRFLHEQALRNRFSSIFVATPEGFGYSSDSPTINIKDRDYFQTAMKGENAISKIITSRKDEQPSIAFAVPIYKNNKVIGVLFCVYHSGMFTELLQGASFNGKGSTLLIQNDGTAIIGSCPFKEGDNYFNAMKTTKISGEFTYDLLIKKVKNNESGFIQYDYQGDSYYTSFVPVHLNDWYIISIVPVSFIQKQSAQISGYVLNMIFEIIAAILIFIFYIFYAEHKHAKKLFESNQKFEALAANIPGGVLRCSTDADMTLDFVSDGCLRFFSCTRKEFTETYQNKFENIIYEKDRAKTMKLIRRQLCKGHHVSAEFRIADFNGDLHWVFEHGRVIAESGNKKWNYAVLTDITNLKDTQEKLRQSMERYSIMMEQSDSVVYEYNLKDNTFYVSDNFKRIFGYELSHCNSPESLYENNIIHPDDQNNVQLLYQQIRDGALQGEIELRIRKIDGTYMWCKMQATTIFDESGMPDRSLAKITNIDDEKAETQRLLNQAQRDSLTGMYNKATAEALINQYLKTEGKSKINALFVVDLDHFKLANDTFGHLFGDSVLIAISSKIKNLFRSSDIISRIGGDEFVICVKNIGSEKAAADKAIEVCDSIKAIILSAHANYKISGSVGIAVYPKDGSNYLELFKKADCALYYSKDHGKNGYTFYSSDNMIVHSSFQDSQH